MGTENFRFLHPATGNLLLRLWCGVIFIRYGITFLHPASMHDFAETLQGAHIPLPFAGAWLCKTTEFIGGVFLVTGFLVRPACLFLIIDMSVATFIFHHGQVLGNGLTTFLLIVCLLAVIWNDAGSFSIDHLFKRVKI